MPNREECSIPCNLCDATSVNVLSLTDRNGGYLRNVICKHCGLIWVDPRPPEEQIHNFYAKTYRREYKGAIKPKKKHIYRDAVGAARRFAFFKDLIRENHKVFDIGAGSGVFVCYLRKLGIDARGVGSDENYAAYARTELDTPVVTGFSREVVHQELPDVVTLNHVLEHMTDPLAELKYIFTTLADNGYLVVETPNAEDFQQAPRHRYHKAHIYTFNPKTLIALGLKAGFNVFRQTIAPYNGNISVIFQKQSVQATAVTDLSNNCARITAILSRYTTLRHFASSIPYVKLYENLATAIKEQLAILYCTSGSEIIDRVAHVQDHHYSLHRTEGFRIG